jgi:hypothetical protein
MIERALVPQFDIAVAEVYRVEKPQNNNQAVRSLDSIDDSLYLLQKFVE